MSFAFRKIAVPLAMLSFLTLALFGFAGMTYAADGSMQGDCPFSTMGASLCPPSALPGAIHHLLAYQSFLNVPVNSGVTALIAALLFAISAAFAFSFHPPLRRILIFIFYDPPLFTSEDRKLKRCLSLFENSPSRQ